MKLILTADVDHLGGVGDTVEVKDGYGRNFLLPRGLAIVASRGAQKQVDDIRRARQTKQVRDLEHANEIKAAIADPGFKARLAHLDGTALGGSPADFGKLIADETEKWRKVIRLANIKPE